MLGTHFSSLPNDVLRIFMRGCDFVTLLDLRKCCRSWQPIVESLIGPIFTTISAEGFHPRRLASLITFLQSLFANQFVQELTIPSSHDHLLPALASLRILKVSGLPSDVFFGDFERLPFLRASFPALAIAIYSSRGHYYDTPLPRLNPPLLDFQSLNYSHTTGLEEPPLHYWVHPTSLFSTIFFLMGSQTHLSLESLSVIAASIPQDQAFLVVSMLERQFRTSPKRTFFYECMANPIKNFVIQEIIERDNFVLFKSFYLDNSWTTSQFEALSACLVREMRLGWIQWIFPRIPGKQSEVLIRWNQ